jgi:hypothetical protein
VDAAVEHCPAGGAARRRHGRALTPLAGGEVEDTHIGDGLERRLTEAAEQVQAAVVILQRGVVYTLGQFRHGAPLVGGRIVAPHGTRCGGALVAFRRAETTRQVDAAAVGRRTHLGALLRQWRGAHPGHAGNIRRRGSRLLRDGRLLGGRRVDLFRHVVYVRSLPCRRDGGGVRRRAARSGQ